MKLAWTALGCLLLAGCAAAGLGPGAVICQTDNQCTEGQVCFPFEGCGDPGSGLVVEIRGAPTSGLLAQDFPIADGGFAPRINFALLAPTSLLGEFQRLTAAGDPLEHVPYSDLVTVKAFGQSELIPGVARTYQASFPKPINGNYSMPVGAGRYVIAAFPGDLAIPPELEDLSVVAGVSNLNFTFPASAGTLYFSGLLVKRAALGRDPALLLTQAGMDLQAFDPLTHRPLSQPKPVSSGYTSSQGTFVLAMAPEAQKLESFLVVATPRDQGAMVPTKTFTIRRPFPDVLEMGDFGDPLPAVLGTVLDSDGNPVAGAAVFLEGPVAGGGTFRSAVVVTDELGVFRVNLLPTAPNAAYQLTALPPADSKAGAIRTQVQTAMDTTGATIVEGVNSRVIRCPAKIQVVGHLRYANDLLARAVPVYARPVEQLKELSDQPLSANDAETVTDDRGSFELSLDPGVWKLTFTPGGELPNTVRLVTVRADPEAKERAIEKVFSLWQGRRVTGQITLPPGNSRAGGGAPNATVRYFRISPIEGKDATLLLGEAVTDDQGEYSVILPAK